MSYTAERTIPVTTCDRRTIEVVISLSGDVVRDEVLAQISAENKLRRQLGMNSRSPEPGVPSDEAFRERHGRCDLWHVPPEMLRC